MKKMSKLEKARHKRWLTREQLAARCSNPDYSYGHMLNIIKTIETGVVFSPRPRKTYEWERLAQALKCKVSDIYEAHEEKRCKDCACLMSDCVKIWKDQRKCCPDCKCVDEKA